VSGWIKRGPSGLIGTNKADSVESVKSLLADAPTLPRPANADPDAVTVLLGQRGVRFVTLADWLTLDRHETERGVAQGRPRVKLTRIEEMLRHLADQAAPTP